MVVQPFAFLEVFPTLTLETHIPCLTRVFNIVLTRLPDFVLDLARNGELQSRISRMGSLSTACARYYAAQLVDALDYMHMRGVIHRYAHMPLSLFPPPLIALPVISNRKICYWMMTFESKLRTLEPEN